MWQPSQPATVRTSLQASTFLSRWQRTHPDREEEPVTYRVDMRAGRYVAAGNTYVDKDALKAAGFVYDCSNRQWSTGSLAAVAQLDPATWSDPVAALDPAGHRLPTGATWGCDWEGGRYIGCAKGPTAAWRDKLRSAGFRFVSSSKLWTRPTAPDGLALTRAAEAAAATERDARAETTRLSSAADLGTLDDDIAPPLPDGLALRPFQLAAVKFLTGRRSVLLADDMGLGKTIEVLAALNLLAPQRVLVVSPLSMTLTSRNELARWSTLDRPIGVATARTWPEDAGWVIIHPEGLTRQAQRLVGHWDVIVVDEAHYFKSPKAQRTRALFAPGVQAYRRWALTGTPIPNRPIELQGILRWLQPDNPEWEWRHYAKTYCALYKDRFGQHYDGASSLDELQTCLRESVMIRRRKADVLADLPAKVRQMIALDPAAVTGAKAAVAAERKAEAEAEAARKGAERVVKTAAPDSDTYREAVRRMSRPALEFDEVARARHNTAVVKAPAVAVHVEDILADTDEKVVVFAHHRDVIGSLAERLNKFGVVTLVGGDSPGERTTAVEAFQRDPGTRVFVGSIQAAGVGLTLTAAATVVFAELDWSPGNITQAEDRIHRIGQTAGSVHVQHLVIDGSVDARIAETLLRKQAIADRALDVQPVAA